MHPLALTSGRHYTGTSKVGKMPRDLWLRLAKDLDQVAYANFLLAHEIQEPQASVVTQSLKEAFQSEFWLCCHVLNIYALTDVLLWFYIRIHGCEEDANVSSKAVMLCSFRRFGRDRYGFAELCEI
jgi:hypothetical protein